MNTTGLAICTGALELLGATPAGQAPSADDLAAAFRVLQELLDAWRLDSLTVLATERAVFPLVVGQGTYSLGPGGDFNRQRPTFLDDAGIITNTGSTQPVEIPLSILTIQQFQLIPVKSVQSSIPTSVYPDGNYDAQGRMNLTFWPIPNAGATSVALYCPTNPVTALTAPTTVYNLAPGYVRALRYCLAMDLAPVFLIEPPQAVIVKAEEYLGDLRRANMKPVLVRVDPALTYRQDRGFFNWLTGQVGRD